MRRFLFLTTIVLIAITLGQLWITKDRTEQKKELEETAGQGEALVGGDFTLTDQDGKTVQEADFRGRVMLVFFGFTDCPDICPVTVASLSKMMTLLGDNANQVAPIFITVDPQRDTPEVLKNYLANFDKRIVALTGTPDDIKKVAELYKVYFSKTAMPMDEKASAGHNAHHGDHDESNADDYAVNHSGMIYLMGKDGKYIRLFPYNADAQEIATAVLRVLER